MIPRFYFPGIIFSCSLLLSACGEKPDANQIHFTKADSLTETYLALQDSMHQSWNMMINDDNQKIEALKNLIHELMVSGGSDLEQLQGYERRVSRLKHLRYTQKSLANADVVAEYDFASNALVSELIAIAETQRQFAYNTTLQKLVEVIRISDQQVGQYRKNYDLVTTRYNYFLNKNRDFLKENTSDSFEPKPLFQVATAD